MSCRHKHQDSNARTHPVTSPGRSPVVLDQSLPSVLSFLPHAFQPSRLDLSLICLPPSSLFLFLVSGTHPFSLAQIDPTTFLRFGREDWEAVIAQLSLSRPYHRCERCIGSMCGFASVSRRCTVRNSRQQLTARVFLLRDSPPRSLIQQPGQRS